MAHQQNNERQLAPLSRRAVLKSLVLGGTGLSLPGTADWYALADSSASEPHKKLGVALVGLGNYSTQMLGPALRQTQWCELRGIVSGTESKRKKWAEDYQLPARNVYTYETFDQVENNPDIDIIYVVLPNFLHAE